MNILLVNPAHPAIKHVSALRAWRFGGELARRGHRVLLLTAQPQAQHPASEGVIAFHTGSPVCVMAPAPLVDPSGSSRHPLMRRALTMVRLVTTGGYQGAWVEAAVGAAIARCDDFRPQVIWATFGQMEAVMVARRLAKRFRVPWVLDLKDNWSLFVPKGLRRFMAWRTRGWSALTANGGLTREQGQRWQRITPELIYSGVDQVFLEPQAPPPDLAQETVLNLVGGLYFHQPLQVLLEGLACWAASRPPSQPPLKLVYYGVDGERLAAANCTLDPSSKLTIDSKGYVAPLALASACQHAVANAYIGHPGTFHHKTLELLACGRPLLVVPGEREESRRLARQVTGCLIEAETPTAVAAACARAELDWQQRPRPCPNQALQHFSWSAQAGLLEQVLVDAEIR